MLESQSSSSFMSHVDRKQHHSRMSHQHHSHFATVIYQFHFSFVDQLTMNWKKIG